MTATDTHTHPQALNLGIPSLRADMTLEARDVQPGMILAFWGDAHVEIHTPPQLHADGNRVMLGDYAVQPGERVILAGTFNA